MRLQASNTESRENRGRLIRRNVTHENYSQKLEASQMPEAAQRVLSVCSVCIVQQDRACPSVGSGIEPGICVIDTDLKFRTPF